MTVFLGRAPARLVIEHEEDVAFFFGIDIIEVLVHVTELKQAFWDEIVLDALILKVPIHDFDEIQVRKSEAVELVGSFVLIEGHYERTIESIMAEKLELLRIVVPSQCLLRALHVKDMQEEVSVLLRIHPVLRVVFTKGRAVDGKVWLALG